MYFSVFLILYKDIFTACSSYELKQGEYRGTQELVKNPLRLSLLCQTWMLKSNSAKLPDTKAGLYEGFIDYISNEWKQPKNLEDLILKLGITEFQYQLPDEYRLDQQLLNFSKQLTIPTVVFDSEHFFTTRLELSNFFKGST